MAQHADLNKSWKHEPNRTHALVAILSLFVTIAVMFWPTLGAPGKFEFLLFGVVVLVAAARVRSDKLTPQKPTITDRKESLGQLAGRNVTGGILATGGIALVDSWRSTPLGLNLTLVFLGFIVASFIGTAIGLLSIALAGHFAPRH